MKSNLITPLLAALVLGLAGLSAYQWMHESSTRKSLQSLRTTHDQLEAQLQQHTNRVQQSDLKVVELTTTLSRFEEIVRTNAFTILGLSNKLSSAVSTNQLLLAKIGDYTNAFLQATNQLSKAYADLKAQNERIQEIAAQRDAFVNQLNDAIEERNKVVAQYNELVNKFEDIQKQLKLPTDLLRR